MSTEYAVDKTHARLREVFRHWLTAAENYSDPEEFRIAINACIQASRNVTFVLQKNKHHIPNFNAWYGPWRQTMEADPIMGWCVDARNLIVKEGDLDTLSVAKVTPLNSHFEVAAKTFIVNPSLSGKEIAEYIIGKYLPDHLKHHGFLQVERQWIVEELAGVELLSALAHSFTVLSLLLSDVSDRNGPEGLYDLKDIDQQDFEAALEALDDDVKPDCMLAFESYRTTHYRLSNGETVSLTEKPVVSDKKFSQLAHERYGPVESMPSPIGDLESLVHYYHRTAKRILEVDGHHGPTVFLFNQSGKPQFFRTEFHHQEDKYLFWREMAKRVIKFRAAKIVAVGDAWRASLESKQLTKDIRVADIPGSEEVLITYGMERSGKVYCISTPYKRTETTIIFGADEAENDVLPNFMLPIKKAFRKLIR